MIEKDIRRLINLVEKKSEDQIPKQLNESTGATDYNPKSQGGTRKELLAKYHETNDSKDAEAARKAGATQQELKQAGKEGMAEGLDSDTQRLEQEVRDALNNGDDYTAKQLVKMASTPEAKKYLLKIIKQEMYGTGPGQVGVMEGSKHAARPGTEKRPGSAEQAQKALDRKKEVKAAYEKRKEEQNKEQGVMEGGMPASVIKQKETLAAMSDKEFAEKYGSKSDEELMSMAGRHGYGENSKRYVEKRNKGKEAVSEASYMMEEREQSPVARSLIHRIMMQHPQLLSTYGPKMVMAAIDDVADSVGKVEEIGGSDIRGWVKQVEQTLVSMNRTNDSYDMDDPAPMESITEGRMKEMMWDDAENMELEDFLDKWAHSPEDTQWVTGFWNSVNGIDINENKQPVRESKSLIAQGINNVLTEGYLEDIGQAVLAYKGKELPLSAKKLEITSNSPHYKLHPDEFKKDVYDQLKDKGVPVTKRSAPAKKVGGLSVTPELLQQVWRKLENVVSNVVPDGDPIDWMAPYIRKMGVDPFNTREILDMAVKRNYDKRSDYSKYLRDMWDAYGEMQGDDYQNPWK